MEDKKMYESENPVEGEELSVVELVDDGGRKMKFYHIGTMDYKEECFAFFQPAEEIEGVNEDEVVIFLISEDENGKEVLLPIEDEKKLDAVYEEFCKAMEEEDECCCGGDCECEDGEECDCGCEEGKECDCHKK